MTRLRGGTEANARVIGTEALPKAHGGEEGGEQSHTRMDGSALVV